MAAITETPGPNTHRGEARMLPDLIRLLLRTRRIGQASIVVPEVRWRGRRIDLVTHTGSGVLSAYELKLRNFGRALEQAIYNSQSFDRSWVVVDRAPSANGLSMAERHGIGVIVVSDDSTRVVLRAAHRRSDATIRKRLVSQIICHKGRIDV